MLKDKTEKIETGVRKDRDRKRRIAEIESMVIPPLPESMRRSFAINAALHGIPIPRNLRNSKKKAAKEAVDIPFDDLLLMSDYPDVSSDMDNVFEVPDLVFDFAEKQITQKSKTTNGGSQEYPLNVVCLYGQDKKHDD
jgi:hypothetical protein